MDHQEVTGEEGLPVDSSNSVQTYLVTKFPLTAWLLSVKEKQKNIFS